MPIKRPAFKLIISEAACRPKDVDSNNDIYPGENLDSIFHEIKKFRKFVFAEAMNIIDYNQMQQSGFATITNGFIISNGNDVFMHAHRECPEYDGTYIGDKIHISIHQKYVKKAFDILSGLLFSQDSPIDKWKVTDIDVVSSESRVSVGAQFTLYMKTESTDNGYTPLQLHKIRCFLSEIENQLKKENIPVGQQPESDIKHIEWSYISYRNEFKSDRTGNEEQNEKLKNEPFFRLITE
ncbi:type III effector phosphothreonine lyase [Escherichia coli]